MPMAGFITHLKRLAKRVIGKKNKPPREPHWLYGHVFVRYFAPYTSDKNRAKMLRLYAIEGATLHEKKTQHDPYIVADEEINRLLVKEEIAQFEKYKDIWKTHHSLVSDLNNNDKTDEKKSTQDLKSHIDQNEKVRLDILNKFSEKLYDQYPKLRLRGHEEDKLQDITDIRDYIHQRAVFECLRVKNDESFLCPYGYENDHVESKLEPSSFSKTIGYSRIPWFIINPFLWGDFLIDQTLGNIAWAWTWGVNGIIHAGADLVGWCMNDEYRYSKVANTLKTLLNVPAIVLLTPEVISYAGALYTNSFDIWKECCTSRCCSCSSNKVFKYSEDDAEMKARNTKRKENLLENHWLKQSHTNQSSLQRSGSSGHVNHLLRQEEKQKSETHVVINIDQQERKNTSAVTQPPRSNSQPNLFSKGKIIQKTHQPRKKGLHKRHLTRAHRTTRGIIVEKNGVPISVTTVGRFRMGSNSHHYDPTAHAKSLPVVTHTHRDNLNPGTFEPPVFTNGHKKAF